MSKKAWMFGAAVAAVALFGVVATAGERNADPINEKCPVSGKAVDSNATATVAVGFCCGNCKGKFEKDPASFLSKIQGKDAK